MGYLVIVMHGAGCHAYGPFSRYVEAHDWLESMRNRFAGWRAEILTPGNVIDPKDAILKD